jgi:hypothetical protein
LIHLSIVQKGVVVESSGRDLSEAVVPGLLLAGAAAVVGVAIALDGTPARVVNGLGVLGWFAAGALLVRSLRRSRGRLVGAAATAAAVLVLAFVVRPSDLVAALVGFSLGGALVATVARDAPLHWALLLPAAWLPAHVAVAIGRSVLAGATSVRTDPPPTAVVVPLAMVAAATAAGLLVARLRHTRRSVRTSGPWSVGRIDPA